MIDVDYNEYKETIAENMSLIVENHRLEEVEKEHQKLNGELREEIERLNNIIKNFEILIKNEINESKLEDDYDRVDSLEYCLATLQELKGDGSNE